VTTELVQRGWTPQEIGDSWLHHLSDEQIADADASIRRAVERGLTLDDVTRDDFPLPTWAPLLATARAALLDGAGFCTLRGLPVRRWSKEACGLFFWGLGSHLGTGTKQNALGHRLGHVRDQGLDYTETNVRGYTTSAALAFHCDGADVVGLLCLRGARSGGLSSLASALRLHQIVSEEQPWMLPMLEQPWHNDIRGEQAEGSPPTYLSPIYSTWRGRTSIRFVPSTLRRAPTKTGVPLTPPEVEVLDFMESLCERPDVRLDMELEPGDIQLANNYTVLHSRTEYVDHEDEAEKRHLLRLWLLLADAPELAPDFPRLYFP
jgi:hypothetical protein